MQNKEYERIPKLKRQDLISIQDGDNGTLTMKKTDFKQLYKEHNVNYI